MPTKDEIALIDNHPLTIAAFLKIRSRLQTRSPETALWVGISMIALQNKTRAEGREISSLAAYDIVRYAIRDLSTSDARSALIEYFRETVPLPDPDFVKKEIQSISDKTSVLRNPLPLSFFK